MPSDFPSGERVHEILARYVERRADGETVSLEGLCREHPSLADELRELAPLADFLLERLSSTLEASLHERIKEQFGSGVDPEVSLEGEGPTKVEFSSEVLSRLVGRGPASTRYRIKGQVAHGGMGAVLRVWDEDLRRHLAMKVMLGKGSAVEQGDTPRVDPRLLGRFLEEAQVTGQLDHPGIVPVHELGLDDAGRVYFTMKLVKGQTLKEVFDELDKGKAGWTQTRVLGLIQKVCEAMSYAHAKGVIHRDLKPANVMVGKFGEVYVMDWGLAKVLGRADQKDIRPTSEPPLMSTMVGSERNDRAGDAHDSTLYTMDGDVVGTPAYMPPEQARGDMEAMGPQADVYAVGAMLYHLLAGHPPYLRPGVRATNHVLWQLVQHGPPDALSALAPHAPSELAAICRRAMEREPRARYSDMSALASDLSAYVEGRVVKAYETGAWAEARKWIQRNRALAASMAAALVLAIGGIAGIGYVEAKGRAAEKSQRLRAEAETAKVLRLSDAIVLEQLEAEAEELWPAQPDRIAAMQAWLDRASALVAHLEGHHANLAEMRTRAHPLSADDRVRDGETHPRAQELAEKRAQLEELIDQLEQGLEGQAQLAAEQRVPQLEAEVASLAEAVESRRTWTLDAQEEQWQHDVLAELVVNLEGLQSGLLAEDTITKSHGWSVPKRLAFARHLEAGFSQGGEYHQAWAAALPAIAQTYPGLELTPQLGLIPIGKDSWSGLWEFAHLMTGTPPEREPNGKLALTEDSALVLVLLPGGSFPMGAQESSGSEGDNYDPHAKDNEGPVHEVELSAYFFSKYEMTQGQWLRLTGRNPSNYGPHNWSLELLQSRSWASLLHPIEQVTWSDCMTWLRRADLALPSEAQWEYGARAGTRTPWWTGVEKESLAGAANIIDAYAKKGGGSSWLGHELWLDDGAVLHTRVGSYAPNAFGLYDVAGNISEWCLDDYDESFYARSPRLDPVAPRRGEVERTLRGGGFVQAATGARSANRGHVPSTYADRAIGVRPARVIAK